MSNWSKNSYGKLHKVYEFKNYRESFAFTTQVAMLAEKSNHHPSIILDYNTVEILLISHDVNAVTERDIKLAGLIDKIGGI